jgi:hypothetical protein
MNSELLMKPASACADDPKLAKQAPGQETVIMNSYLGV